MKKSLRQYYEREGKNVRRYDSVYFWDSRYHRKRKEHILQILKSVCSKGIFLDIGCGTGEYLFEAAGFNVEPVGLDVSKTYLKNIKKMHRKPQLVQADAQALPLKDKCAECILCSETIEHLPNFGAAISEIVRVGRKTVVISTPNYGLLRIMLAKISKPSVKKLDKSVGHINVLTLPKLHEKVIENKCRIKLEKTIHVTPPLIGERLSISPKLASFLDVFERILNSLLPSLGNITLMVCEAA